MSPEQYAQLLVDCGAVEVRSDPREWFTWSSGARAPIYCDNRILLSFPSERAVVADGLVEAVKGSFGDVDVVAGTATAGIAHAAWVAERLERPMVYVRGSAKGHGKHKQVEGVELNGERVVLIEDTISLAGSSGSAVEALVREGGKVLGVQAIFSYGFPAADRRLAELGVPWQSLTGFDALLASLDLEPSVREQLGDWREGFSG